MASEIRHPIPPYLLPHARTGAFVPPKCISPADAEQAVSLSVEERNALHRKLLKERCLVIDANSRQIGLQDGDLNKVALSVANRLSFSLDKLFVEPQAAIHLLAAFNGLFSGTPGVKRPIRHEFVAVFRNPYLDEEIIRDTKTYFAWVEKHDSANLAQWTQYFNTEAARFGEEINQGSLKYPIHDSRVLSPETKSLLLQHLSIPLHPKFIPEKLNEFCAEMKNLITQKRDPIDIAAFAHMELVRIHPFDDQNGRTARLFMNFILSRLGLPAVYFYSDNEYSAAVIQSLDHRDSGAGFRCFRDFLAKKVASFQNLIALAKKRFKDFQEQQACIAEMGFLTCERFDGQLIGPSGKFLEELD